MQTIYQIYINNIPSKHVFFNECDARLLLSKIKLLYRKIEIISFNVPVK